MASQSITSGKELFDMCLLISILCGNHYPTPMLCYQILPDVSLNRFSLNLNLFVDLHAWEHLKSLKSRHSMENFEFIMASKTVC